MTAPAWKIVGGIGIDSATCAFADGSVVGPGFSLRDRPEVASVDGVVEGLPLVKCCTRADMELPVEVILGADRGVTATRLAFVEDLDDLAERGEGKWQAIGSISIASPPTSSS